MPFEPLRLTVLTPAEILLEVPEADWIEGQLADGVPIGIYPGHAPLIAETEDGPLRYADARGQHTIDLGAGVLHVSDGQVTILICGRICSEVPLFVSMVYVSPCRRQYSMFRRYLEYAFARISSVRRSAMVTSPIFARIAVISR